MAYDDLDPTEHALIGTSGLRVGDMAGDSVSQRINWLITHRLERLGASASGWDVLYRDPRDLRLWKLSYPNSDSHGGGPPALLMLSLEVARQEFSNQSL